MGAYIRTDKPAIRADVERVFALFPGSRSGGARPPARCRAASSRCSRWAAR
jgi:hypothetical protein